MNHRKYAPISVALTTAQQFRASKRLGAMTQTVRVALAELLATLAVPASHPAPLTSNSIQGEP